MPSRLTTIERQAKRQASPVRMREETIRAQYAEWRKRHPEIFPETPPPWVIEWARRHGTDQMPPPVFWCQIRGTQLPAEAPDDLEAPPLAVEEFWRRIKEGRP